MTGPITDFATLETRFFQHYNAGDFQAALDLLRGDSIDLPHHAPILAFWEVAMLARLDRAEEAVARLEAVLDAGYWMHEDGLRDDPDFAALLTQPGIEGIIDRLSAARMTAAAETEPLLSIMEPESAPPWPLLLALHGNMGNLEVFAPSWTSAAQAGWLVAAPQSVQPSWVSGFYGWSDEARAHHQIAHHMHTLRELYALDEDRIVLAGFSQGGHVAMQAALDRSIPAQGFIGVEGWLFDLEQAERLLDAAEGSTLRCYFVAGENTRFHQGAQALCDLLSARGMPYALELTATTTHALPPDFDAVLRRALDFVLGL